MQNCDSATIGNLMVRHRDNRGLLRELRSRLDEIEGQLSDLSRMAGDHKKTIHLTDLGFRSGYGDTTVPFDLLDSLREVLTELDAAGADQQRIETCLEDVGMGEYIIDQ